MIFPGFWWGFSNPEPPFWVEIPTARFGGDGICPERK